MKVLHIIGVSNGWALENRARALMKAMPQVDTVCDCYKDLAPHRVTGFDFLHLHGLQIVPLIQRILAQNPVWGFEVISERSLKCLRMPNVKKLLAQASVCWVKNPSLTPFLVGMTPNIVFIPNGVDCNLFRPQIRVGWVGNNRDKKHRDYKGVSLIEKAVMLLQERLKLLADIVFVPPPAVYPKVVPQSELVHHYRSLDMLVCASVAEGCSNVVNEALACGIPVVSVQVGIAKELKALGARIVIVDRTVDGLAQGIYRAARSKIQRAVSMHSMGWESEMIAGQYLDTYEKALEEKATQWIPGSF